MMLSEFVERTGFEPMAAEYAKIEEAYCNFDGDKDAFCRAFVEGDGVKTICQLRAAEIERLNGKLLEMDKAAMRDGKEYEKRLADLQAKLNQEQPEEPVTMGNGCSYIVYISTSHDKVSALHRPMLDLAALHPGWHWHVSTVQVLEDCRIPALYHSKGYWATLVEHNNGSWDKAPTYEIHCI